MTSEWWVICVPLCVLAVREVHLRVGAGRDDVELGVKHTDALRGGGMRRRRAEGEGSEMLNLIGVKHADALVGAGGGRVRRGQ